MLLKPLDAAAHRNPAIFVKAIGRGCSQTSSNLCQSHWTRLPTEIQQSLSRPLDSAGHRNPSVFVTATDSDENSTGTHKLIFLVVTVHDMHTQSLHHLLLGAIILFCRRWSGQWYGRRPWFCLAWAFALIGNNGAPCSVLGLDAAVYSNTCAD